MFAMLICCCIRFLYIFYLKNINTVNSFSDTYVLSTAPVVLQNIKMSVSLIKNSIRCPQSSRLNQDSGGSHLKFLWNLVSKPMPKMLGKVHKGSYFNRNTDFNYSELHLRWFSSSLGENIGKVF